MAVMKQGILGGLSGKIGSVIGSSWKGIAVLKSRPLSVANPQTAGQVAQRSKFSNTIAFASLILATVIKPLWDRFASQMSGYNAFVQSNLDLFAGALPSTFADLVISKGKMAASPISGASTVDGSPDVDMTFTDESGEGFKLATDIAYIVIINETNGEIKGFSTTAARSSLHALVTMDNDLTSGDVLHMYLAFRRADGTVVSNSSYKMENVV